MKIIQVRIQRYGSLKDITINGHRFIVFIGSNGQGKSLIFEALYRFFADFNSIGGGASPGISDIIWYKRETSSPIEFEMILELD